MGKTDTAPDEKVRETGESQKPAEERGAGGCFVDEGEETNDELDNDTPDRAAFAVNVHEEFRPHASGCERLHGPRGSKGAGIRDTEDGYGDDGVEDRGKTADSSQLDCNDKRGSLGVGAG